jgi:hypothetical protein
MVVRLLPTGLTIKHATLTVEDKHGNVMKVEIDTDTLMITSVIDEGEAFWPDPVAAHITPRVVATEFSMRTEAEYWVTYDQKEQV